jgi:para-aminobenzoate synthetase/4-amino-4-deoxychorismate lyase
VVEKLAGRLVTPPVSCGLLPGTLRQELVERGLVTEEVVRKEELFSARRLWLINSVRGWRRVTLHAEGERC